MNCQTQEEVDDLWEKLSEGGEKEQCGWLKDKFGVSWQIVPNVLDEMLQDKDAKKSESHEGDASNEENRHTRLEEGIRGIIVEDRKKIKTTCPNVHRQLYRMVKLVYCHYYLPTK